VEAALGRRSAEAPTSAVGEAKEKGKAKAKGKGKGKAKGRARKGEDEEAGGRRVAKAG